MNSYHLLKSAGVGDNPAVMDIIHQTFPGHTTQGVVGGGKLGVAAGSLFGLGRAVLDGERDDLKSTLKKIFMGAAGGGAVGGLAGGAFGAGYAGGTAVGSVYPHPVRAAGASVVKEAARGDRFLSAFESLVGKMRAGDPTAAARMNLVSNFGKPSGRVNDSTSHLRSNLADMFRNGPSPGVTAVVTGKSPGRGDLVKSVTEEVADEARWLGGGSRVISSTPDPDFVSGGSEKLDRLLSFLRNKQQAGRPPVKKLSPAPPRA